MKSAETLAGTAAAGAGDGICATLNRLASWPSSLGGWFGRDDARMLEVVSTGIPAPASAEESEVDSGTLHISLRAGKVTEGVVCFNLVVFCSAFEEPAAHVFS